MGVQIDPLWMSLLLDNIYIINQFLQSGRKKQEPSISQSTEGRTPTWRKVASFCAKKKSEKKTWGGPPLHAVGFNGKSFLGPPVALIFEDIVHRPEDEANENEKERERDGEKGADPVEDGNRGVGAFDHLQMWNWTFKAPGMA